MKLYMTFVCASVVLSTAKAICGDVYKTCTQYKSTGWYGCNVGSFMYDYCKKTCGYCNGGTIPTPKPGCHDFEKNCPSWLKSGQCQSNPMFMSKYCCQTCKGVKPTQPTSTKHGGFCKDSSNQCSYYKSTGWYGCNVGSYMYDYCKKTCGYCNGGTIPTPKAGCHNFEKNCATWVKMKECKSNPKFMQKYCCAACRHS